MFWASEMKYLDILVDTCFFTEVIIFKIVIKSNQTDNIYGHNLIAPFLLLEMNNTVYFVSN